MIRLLQFLFFGHIHKWVDVGSGRWQRGSDEAGPRYVCKCEKCGAYRAFDL